MDRSRLIRGHVPWVFAGLAIGILSLLSFHAWSNTKSDCVPADVNLLIGEIIGVGPMDFMGNRGFAPRCNPPDGSTYSRNPYYTSGVGMEGQFATAGFHYTPALGHNCETLIYVTSDLDGTGGSGTCTDDPKGIHINTGTSLGGGTGSYVAGTTSCEIRCQACYYKACCSCTCEKMSYTLL